MPDRQAAILLVLAPALVAGCAAVPPREAPQRTIGVTGTGRVSVRPDVALVRVGVETRAPALADATADAARRMTAVVAQVKALGVQNRDVTTVSYDIQPLATPRQGEEQPPRVLGYRVVNIAQLRVRDLDAAGRILDAAVAAGANVVQGFHFTLDDPARARAEARKLAVADAVARARQLADAAGARLGELVSLTEGVASAPVVQRLERAALSALAPGPIETGELEIVVTVEAHYRIAP